MTKQVRMVKGPELVAGKAIAHLVRKISVLRIQEHFVEQAVDLGIGFFRQIKRNKFYNIEDN
jgi:hypothetical protein